MNCPKCQTQNDENAQFCRNCGTNLHQVLESKTVNNASDILLVIFILIALVSAIVQFSMQKFVDNWYEGPTKYIQGVFWILQNLSFLLLAFAIKNKPLKIIGIVLVVLLASYWIYSNVEFMLR